MSKKIKYIVAAVLAAVVCVAVIFTINRKKSGINMNVGELSGDEQNYWNPDIHSISSVHKGFDLWTLFLFYHIIFMYGQG